MIASVVSNFRNESFEKKIFLRLAEIMAQKTRVYRNSQALCL